MANEDRNEARATIDGIASGEIIVPMKDGYSTEEYNRRNNEIAVSNMLKTNGNGAPYQTLSNNLIVLENDCYLQGRFGYDCFTLENTVEPPLPWEPKGAQRHPLEKHDVLEFAVYAEQYCLNNDQRAAKAIEVACHRNEYDSAQQVLESLEYEGEVHREDALTLFLGAEDSEYTRAVSKLAFDGATMRIMHPGCKYDYILAIIGPQGMGKSQFARRMALNSSWYIDKIENFDKSEGLQLLRAKIVYEIAELSDIKNARLERLKQWVTSQVDTYRAPYDIRSADHPRRFIIIATTNETAFLDDPTGNRRWLPVRCSPERAKLDLFDNEVCSHWFSQAYAEAMVEYRENDGKLPLVLPKSVEPAAEEARESAYVEDPDEGRIAAYMMDHPNTRVCSAMVLQEAYYDAGVPTRDTPTATKVASVLNSFDWVTKGDKKDRVGAYPSVRWWIYEI